MPGNKMSRDKLPNVYVLHGELKAMGVPTTKRRRASYLLIFLAAQIMLSLIQSALGTLWFFLYQLEDEKYTVGSTLMMVAIGYLFVSGAVFISSGSSTVIQGSASLCQIVLAIVMNTISIFVAIIGMIIFGIEFPAFEEIGIEYIWSNMAGMMLLQICIISTMSELVIAIIVVHWFRKTLRKSKPRHESSSTSEFSSESPSPYELERVSECSQ